MAWLKSTLVISLTGVNFYYGPAQVDSRYLEVQGTHWNMLRYPYLDIADLQNWEKNKLSNHISQMNM